MAKGKNEYVVDKSKLTNGMIIESHPALCKLMGWKVYKTTSASGKAQLKALTLSCKWHKEGRSYVIDEVYLEDLQGEDGRSKGGNAIFKDNTLQDLIKLKLVQSSSSDIIVFPKSLIYSEFELVNKYYSYYNENRQELLYNVIGLDHMQLEYFFKGLDRTLKGVIERDLEQLAKDGFVLWKETRVKVVKRQGDGELVHYLCTDEELGNILTVESQVCDEMGYKNTYEVKLASPLKRSRFYDRVQYVLNKKYNMYFTYSYRAYKIVFNKTEIQDDLNRRELGCDNIKQLSESVRTTMIQAVRKRINNTQERPDKKSIKYQKHVKDFDGLGKAKSQWMTEHGINETDEMAMLENFNENMEYLISLCMLDVNIRKPAPKLEPMPNIIITSKAREDNQPL